ncbi:hypothetical protein BS329_14285 [Amycolatopsis coloradensis]|uniref:Uncharacterized protein n=1 Tax=Amycolatopsis coloradensis TaxID=76021 RepID=A0A1R0KV09_9PSEU|nr:hypothetical protein BS329_14285 [Amycolatopsis coloradensis]
MADDLLENRTGNDHAELGLKQPHHSPEGFATFETGHEVHVRSHRAPRISMHKPDMNSHPQGDPLRRRAIFVPLMQSTSKIDREDTHYLKHRHGGRNDDECAVASFIKGETW